MTLQAGETLGSYVLEAPLAEGGMATLWRVRHQVLDSPHALKVLRPELVVVEALRARFLAEGRIQAHLRHPHVAAVTDVVIAPGVAGLIMELLEGESLEARLQRDGPLDTATLLSVFLPVLDAVAWAHEHDVVHRDIKPANLFLARGARGRVRPVVLDFGVARVGGDVDLRQTAAGIQIGTPHYMSPEQVRDPRAVDPRSDLFALGATLYEAATGRLAFPGDTEREIGDRILSGHVADADAGPLRDVIRRALAVDVAARFQSAGEMADALELAVRGPLPAWVRPKAPTPAPPAPQRVGWFVEAPTGERTPVSAPAYVHGLRGGVHPLPAAPIRFSHAVLRPSAEGLWLEPKGVALAVSVDGVRVTAPLQLVDGQAVDVAGHRFIARRGPT